MSYYNIGYEDYTHKGKLVRSIVGNSKAIDFVTSLSDIQNDVGEVPAAFEKRPDLIAYVFYANPALFWFIMMANVKPNIFEDFTAGTRIVIPKL